MIPSLPEILRNTLSDIEQNAKFRHNEPKLLSLRKQITKTLAEFEMMRATNIVAIDEAQTRRRSRRHGTANGPGSRSRSLPTGD